MDLFDISLLAHSPVCSLSRLAIACEVSEGTVRGWINKNYVPSVKIGRHTMVNLAKFKQDLLKQA